nr:hypothetical protein BaRGS_020760 [Batillaria attramentaria]
MVGMGETGLFNCGGVLTDQSGSFASPNWPRNYEHNVNCTWHIRVITFDFVHFDLGPKTVNPCDAANDRLVISEVTSNGIVRFCATAPITTYESHTNEVTMQFITNNNVDAQGFRVFYKGDWPCNAILTEDNGEIASPAWPLQYPPLLDCTWTIRAPLDAQVVLQFSAIDLDGQGFGRCTDLYDVIEVFDGDSPASARLGMMCGHDPMTSYTSRLNVLLVKFKTDAHIQRTGFHATYSFLYKSTTTSTTSTPTVRTTTEHSRNKLRGTSLTALFVEPAHDVKRDWAVSSPLPGNDTSRNSIGRDGGVYQGPDLRETSSVSEAFVRTMWALVISLLTLLVLLLTILLLVCRHYR